MKTIRFSLILALFALFFFISGTNSFARDRFVEGDWIAWGDTRDFYDFSVGRTTLYIGTDYGVLRYDRNEKRWLNPWYSVPGSFNEAIMLTGVRRVREDPLTGDIYVNLKSGWVRRNSTNERWERIKGPSADVLERTHQGAANDAKPGPHVIMPYDFTIGPENELHHRYSSWDFAGGVEDEWGRAIYGWTGYGLGTLSTYSPTLELYPGGPGPATAMAVGPDAIWCASTLDRDRGWVWERNNSKDRWTFYQPDNEWGLEPADVQEMEVGPDGSVWIATTQGVMYRSNERWRQIRKQDGLPRMEVLDVQPVSGGAWAATRNGLAFVDRTSGVVLRPDKKLEPIPFFEMFYQLAADGDTLYAAANSILLKHTPNGPWIDIEVPGVVAAGSVPTALYAEKGILAVGTATGLAWRDGNGEWKQALSNQWSGGAVFDIDYHGGYFWLGTDRGLVKYDPREKDAIRYTAKEGLAGRTVFSVKGEGDYLWLGTDVALVRFYWNAPGRLD